MNNGYNRNIRVFAENGKNRHEFDIYLDISGRREYLISHRHNGLIFTFLKDGVRVADMKRWNLEKAIRIPGGDRATRYNSVRVGRMVRHLVRCIDSYLEDREGIA